MSVEVTVDDADGNLLVGVDGERLSASACLDADADESDIAETLGDLERELRHSARVNGGSQA